MKSISIFKSLIKNIAIPVIIIILGLASLSIFQIKNILFESLTIKNNVITSEIKYLLEFRDIALELLEKNIDNDMFEKSETILNKYIDKCKNIEQIDLFEIRDQMNMDSINEDIYIINSNGIVVNTTFKEDKNLNLFSFGSDHRNYLLGILNSGKFVSERFTIETTTRRLRKYCYQPTKDGKYILEIGTYSKRADNIIDLVQARLKNISESDSRIKHVDLIMGADYPFSFNKNPKLLNDHRNILGEIFSTKENKSIQVFENGEKNTYKYIYMRRKNTQLYKNSVIQIIINEQIDKNKIKHELVKFALLFIISIILLVAIIYLQSSRISKPIKLLLEATNNLLRKDKKLNFENCGISELNILSDNFSKMSLDLNERANQLIEASLREQMKEKEAEMAYKSGVNESVSSYLHHIGNSLTEINHQISKINTIRSAIEQYPEIFIKVREAHKKALKYPDKFDETLKLLEKFEVLLTEKIADSLKSSTREILDIKNQMVNSLKEQQVAFDQAKDQGKKHISEIRINDLIKNIITDFDLQLKTLNIDVITDFKEDLIIYNQKQQILQGISSIIKNAIEAIDVTKKQQKGIIKILTKKEVLSNDPFDYKVYIIIEDNGIGVSNNNLNKIFRAGFTTKKMRSGLNLHNFINFLNYNKGKIKFESEGIDKGAQISIIIGNE